MILEFITVAVILEITPGPNMAYLAMLTLERGRRDGFFAIAGVAAGLATHAILASIGIGALIEQSALAYEILRWAGVSYLLYLAWSGWRSEEDSESELAGTGLNAAPLFLRGFLSNIFNPKSVIFFVSVLPGFIQPGSLSAPLQMALLGGLYVSIATGVHGLIVLMANGMRKTLLEGGRRARVRKTLSVLLAVVALWLAWTTQR